MTTLSNQKLENAKYRFGLQNGIKNSIRQDFLIRVLQLVGNSFLPPPSGGLKSVTFKRNRLVRVSKFEIKKKRKA